MSCPNNAACPGLREHPDGAWIATGPRASHGRAREAGNNPDPVTETSVELPAEVVHELLRAERDRIADAIRGTKLALRAPDDDSRVGEHGARAGRGQAGTWFRDTPEARRLLEIERAKVEDGETAYTNQAAERLQRLTDADPESLPPMPPLNLGIQRSRTLTVAQAQRMVRTAVTERDKAILTTLQPALRAVLADRTAKGERIDDLYERLHELEVTYCELWDAHFSMAAAVVPAQRGAAGDDAEQAAEREGDVPARIAAEMARDDALARSAEPETRLRGFRGRAREAGNNPDPVTGTSVELPAEVVDELTLPDRERIAQLEAELRKYRGWEVEDEQYQILLGETVYDECSARGFVEEIVARLRAEIAADELEDGPISVRWTRQLMRYADPDLDLDRTPEHPFGHGVTAPILLINPDALQAAADRLERWAAYAEANRPGYDHLADIAYDNHPVSDSDLKILLVDYRHHRPTQWAYDLACKVLRKHSARADAAEAELAELKAARPCGRSATHPPHKWISSRRTVQCLGVGEYDQAPASAQSDGAR